MFFWRYSESSANNALCTSGPISRLRADIQLSDDAKRSARPQNHAAMTSAPQGTRSFRQSGHKKRPQPSGCSPSKLNPAGVPLSHGETTHFHRRRAFSLASSKRDRVVPTRYYRQENCYRLNRHSRVNRRLRTRCSQKKQNAVFNTPC